ncbi:MAG: hypothetical protein HQK50_06305 [Oligoflexia bacterium]|nr:hypothetical protein [Oligoflexia bacterium]
MLRTNSNSNSFITSVLISLVLFFSIFFFSIVNAHATLFIDKVYLPDNIKSNDKAEIIVIGTLPNLCYEDPTSSNEINKSAGVIEVKLLSEVKQTTQFCMQMIRPFMKTINLGHLVPGHYTIVINNGEASEYTTELNVNMAASAAIERSDDFETEASASANMDASADNKSFNKNLLYVSTVESANDTREIILHGYTISDCYVLDRVEWKPGTLPHTYRLDPLVKKVSNFCPRKMMPVEFKWEIPKNMGSGDPSMERLLLKVSSANGKEFEVTVSNEN